MILIHSPIVKRRRIPLMPLIDVIFILVMFFLLSSTFGVWRPLDVSLGGAGAIESNTQQSPDVPAVLIAFRQGSDGTGTRLTVNGVDVALDRLSSELNRLARLGAERAILIPAKGTEFQQVVNILDEARSSQIRSVSLQLN